MSYWPDTKRSDGPTFVYVLSCQDHVKIGLAVNVESRRKAIQASCPYEVRTAAIILFDCFATAREIERELHEAFSERRGFGEWFAMPSERAVEALMAYEVRAYAPEPFRQPDPPAKADTSHWTAAERRLAKALEF